MNFDQDGNQILTSTALLAAIEHDLLAVHDGPFLRELGIGERFRFWGELLPLEYRGNGWYGTPRGYDGGPWHADGNPAVIRQDWYGNDLDPETA